MVFCGLIVLPWLAVKPQVSCHCVAKRLLLGRSTLLLELAFHPTVAGMWIIIAGQTYLRSLKLVCIDL